MSRLMTIMGLGAGEYAAKLARGRRGHCKSHDHAALEWLIRCSESGDPANKANDGIVNLNIDAGDVCARQKMGVQERRLRRFSLVHAHAGRLFSFQVVVPVKPLGNLYTERVEDFVFSSIAFSSNSNLATSLRRNPPRATGEQLRRAPRGRGALSSLRGEPGAGAVYSGSAR